MGDVGTTHIRKPPKSKFYFWFLVFGWNIKEGVEIRVLAERAGHASIQTTQRYIDVTDEQIRRAAELIRSESC